MMDFLRKNKNTIITVLNVLIVAIGVIIQDWMYVGLGILLFGLNYYVIKQEKKAEEEKAQMKAEKKAKLKEEKLRMKGKKNKKNKKRK